MGPSSSRDHGKPDENIGFISLNPEEHDTPEIQSKKQYPLDIIAVHGITGNAYGTWTYEHESQQSDCLWLRDILPKRLPGARVFSFGYRADVFNSIGTGNLDDFGRGLLEHIDGVRDSRKVRCYLH